MTFFINTTGNTTTTIPNVTITYPNITTNSTLSFYHEPEAQVKSMYSSNAVQLPEGWYGVVSVQINSQWVAVARTKKAYKTQTKAAEKAAWLAIRVAKKAGK